MHIVLVHIHVKSEFRDAFILASLENARSSIQEPGIRRFDFIQQVDDPDRFILVEAYSKVEDQGKHRETAHYLAWRETVAEMIAEPRVGVTYSNVYPPDEAWVK